ncbi:chitinase, partial [Halteromyces radiatus]|uniref:chitinase n=1 Tax=Halteromyces radiatus TaxID=101107 RepID=UPI00222029DD
MEMRCVKFKQYRKKNMKGLHSFFLFSLPCNITFIYFFSFFLLYSYMAAPPPPVVNGPVIAGYFANWGIYARNYNVIDLAHNADRLTHILYAFANIEPSGQVVLGDKWADTDKHFSPEQSVDGKGDPWSENDTENLFGNFKQLYLLKRKYRHLKVSLSIGGWTWSTNFAAVANDPQKRALFVQSAIKHLADLGLDGIDIDWEYPKNEQEALSYVHLLYEVRLALDAYQQQVQQTNQPRLTLSVAVPCGPSQYRILRLRDMAPYVDLFYLMAYDFAGSWDAQTGHQSALYGEGLNCHQAISDYIAAGVPPQKLVMGMPAYGRAFSNTSGPGAAFQGVPEGSWEKGQYDYKALPRPGAQEFNDPNRCMSWSYDPQQREFVTYDSPVIVQAKCDYIKQAQLGGAMFWELSADHPRDHPRSLVQTVYQNLGHLDSMPNHLDYPASQYANMRASMNS